MKGMYEKLKYWSHHNNRDLLHLGMSAIDAFLSQVIKIYVNHISINEYKPYVM